MLVRASIIVPQKISHLTDLIFGCDIHFSVFSKECVVSSIFDLDRLGRVHKIISCYAKDSRNLADLIGGRAWRVFVFEFPNIAFARIRQFSEFVERVTLRSPQVPDFIA